MIVEMRTYTVQNGSTEECLRIYETAGLAIQKEVLGNLIAYFLNFIKFPNFWTKIEFY